MILENIKQLANKVRNEIYGRDVRESIAQSMEVSGETSNEANERSKDTAGRQTDVENRFDDQIAGNADIDEVIDARRPEGGKSYPTLRKRLDDEHKEVTTQLAQITLNIKSFGAKGDGVTNDTVAFQNAAAAINAAGGGKLIIPRGVYIVGEQTFAGETGKGYAYRQEYILRFENCTKPVVIEGNGATLKADSNLRFGSFDPITGEPHTPTMPFLNHDYRADAYSAMIRGDDNLSITIRDLELDGNVENIILGGTWGDVGRQCNATGIILYNTENIIIENVHTHHHALDGLAVGHRGLSEADSKKPVTLTNVTSEYNARQGFSWVGGKGLVAINCKFNHTGRARFHSLPAAGVDIEAENSICRDGLFINCEMINNEGMAFVAESGDSGHITFKNCVFWGTTNTAVWPNKPYIVFEDCKIYGNILRAYGSENAIEATKFIRCHIEDKEHPIYGYFSSDWLINIDAHNALFEDCSIVANHNKPIITAGNETQEIFRRTKIMCKYNDPAVSTSQIVLYGSLLEDVTIDDDYPITPTRNYFINISSGSVKVKGRLNVKATHTSWQSWSMGVNGGHGMLGLIGQNYSESVPHINLHKRMWDTSIYGISKLGSTNAIPTTGSWSKGDIVFNDSPVVGGYVGWVCTNEGTPGTWKGFGLIES